jgi:uncharacterized protein (TIGR00369 family)
MSSFHLHLSSKQENFVDIQTHQKISPELCGEPVDMDDGYCQVRLKTTSVMVTDRTGLVHGGFIFGAADYAAMLAVNHPNVVLAASNVKFLKPVRLGETVMAEARIKQVAGKKRSVSVKVRRVDEKVFEGEFTCFVPERHVLDAEKK